VCLWLLLFKEYPFLATYQWKYDPVADKAILQHHKTQIVRETPLDKKSLLTTDNYLEERMLKRGLLPMITEEVFNVFHKIFKPEKERITAMELADHEFCRPSTEETAKNDN